MKYRLSIFFFLLNLGLICPAVSETVPENVLKSVMIERISRFVEWPQLHNNPNDNAPFIIGLVGKVDFAQTLSMLYNERLIKNKNVKIVELQTNEDFDQCHIVIIGKMNRDQVNILNLKLQNKPILIISDVYSISDADIMIQFYESRNRLRFNIDAEGIKKAGLNIDFRLLQYAKDIQIME